MRLSVLAASALLAILPARALPAQESGDEIRPVKEPFQVPEGERLRPMRSDVQVVLRLGPKKDSEQDQVSLALVTEPKYSPGARIAVDFELTPGQEGKPPRIRCTTRGVLPPKGYVPDVMAPATWSRALPFPLRRRQECRVEVKTEDGDKVDLYRVVFDGEKSITVSLEGEAKHSRVMDPIDPDSGHGFLHAEKDGKRVLFHVDPPGVVRFSWRGDEAWTRPLQEAFMSRLKEWSGTVYHPPYEGNYNREQFEQHKKMHDVEPFLLVDYVRFEKPRREWKEKVDRWVMGHVVPIDHHYHRYHNHLPLYVHVIRGFPAAEIPADGDDAAALRAVCEILRRKGDTHHWNVFLALDEDLLRKALEAVEQTGLWKNLDDGKKSTQKPLLAAMEDLLRARKQGLQAVCALPRSFQGKDSMQAPLYAIPGLQDGQAVEIHRHDGKGKYRKVAAATYRVDHALLRLDRGCDPADVREFDLVVIP